MGEFSWQLAGSPAPATVLDQVTITEGEDGRVEARQVRLFSCTGIEILLLFSIHEFEMLTSVSFLHSKMHRFLHEN